MTEPTITIRQQPGIAVNYLLTKLTRDELLHLRATALIELRESAPVFTDWLTATIGDELDRRNEFEYDPREPDCVRLPAMKWAGADLGDALVAANMLSYVLEESEAGNFIDRLVMALAAICRARLSKT